jgi:hypothetical protein
MHICLGALDDLCRAHLELCAKNPVPEAACDAKAILVVGKVVLEMILLQFLVVCRESVNVSCMVVEPSLDLTYFWWWRK